MSMYAGLDYIYVLGSLIFVFGLSAKKGTKLSCFFSLYFLLLFTYTMFFIYFPSAREGRHTYFLVP